jgi:hypothetical protein
MTTLTDTDACAHPAYPVARHRATERARAEGGCFSIYFDGAAIFVRASEAAAPPNSKLVCIAQRWDDKTVQLRFSGARSEWVNV